MLDLPTIDVHNRAALAAKRVRTSAWMKMATAALAMAATSLSVAAQTAEPAPGVGPGGVLKALLALAVVLVAVFAIAWVARRVSPARVGGSSLKVQGGLSVGTRERVMLVEIEDTWLVLGVAPGRVNLLHTLPRPEGAATAGVAPTSEGTFATWLSNAIKRQTNA